MKLEDRFEDRFPQFLSKPFIEASYYYFYLDPDTRKDTQSSLRDSDRNAIFSPLPRFLLSSFGRK
jgi:hypothetical protein